MRKTYAYNSIFIGFLLALVVYVSTESAVLGILTLLGVSIGGFVLIRALENAMYRGADKAADAITKKIQEKRNGGSDN
jgi:Na+/melibiose symporter-like transporter